MTSNGVGSDTLSPNSVEQAESPCKKPRLDISTRKSWSFMDKKPDNEVLQEMGVSLLEPDEMDPREGSTVNCIPKCSQKRKYDLENVNPNANIAGAGKLSPGPLPGGSRIRSPRTADQVPLKPLDQQALETSIIDQIHSDEETPMAQLLTQHHPAARHQGFGNPDRDKVSAFPVTLQHQSRPPIGLESTTTPQIDSFSVLSDEMMLSVFRWLPKRTLSHCMLVCERWRRVATDESLWQRLDLGNKVLAPSSLGRVLNRQPLVLRLQGAQIGPWNPQSLPPTRVQYLSLGAASIDRIALRSLILRCPSLRKLCLESLELSSDVGEAVGRCCNLETLNLTMAKDVSTECITAILDGCSNLQALNLSWCDLSEATLEVVVAKLPQKLQRLNISGARCLNDDMVISICSRCPRLLELDVSDCGRLSSRALSALSALTRLEHLALSRCYLLAPHSFTKLGSMPSLQYLEVWGTLQSASLSALRASLPAVQINNFMFSAIARPTVGTRRTSIWGLRTRD